MALDAVTDLNPSPRVLLGPGPSAVHPRVLRAMSTPLLGYMDPEFLKLMDETVALLRHTFQTANTLTLPVSGTGMAGMETVLANLLAPGEKLLVCSAGFFANRQEEVARRHGIDVVRVHPDGIVPLVEGAAAYQAEMMFDKDHLYLPIDGNWKAVPRRSGTHRASVDATAVAARLRQLTVDVRPRPTATR